jgi:hypothetical protein
VVKADLGKVLLKLEPLQDEQIREAMKPKETTVELTDGERTAALKLLKSPNLLDRILEDSRAAGWWARRRTSSSAPRCRLPQARRSAGGDHPVAGAGARSWPWPAVAPRSTPGSLQRKRGDEGQRRLPYT